MNDKTRMILLERFGFTAFEAAVYLELTKTSPQTGYKIAKTIGKTRSSTYLVLNNLINKEAVYKLEGRNNQEFAAVPIEEMLESQEKRFTSQKSKLIEAFQDMTPTSQEDQIFMLQSSEQMMQRAQEMIRNGNCVLLDASTRIIKMLQKELITAGNAGKKVIMENGDNYLIDNCVTIHSASFPNEPDAIPFDWLVLSTDAEKCLIAYFETEGEFITGIWMSNLYLANWFSYGMFSEILIRYILSLFNSDKTKAEILEESSRFHQQYIKHSSGINKMVRALRNHRKGW